MIMSYMITLPSREEWLRKRKSYIGGSDASAIVGLNPYKTNLELWEEKTGRRTPADISGKSYVQYGHNAEEHLRSLFGFDYPEYELFYADNNMWLSDSYPYAHASLDGWLVDSDGRRGVLEIKTTNILQSMQKEKWNNRIPDNYYIQVLHYLMVTGWDFAVVKAQLKSEFGGEVYLQTRHYKIERSDVQEDIQYLAHCEEKFYQNIVRDSRPALILPAI